MAEPGAIVGDRYRLDELIGTGGMAAVFRAWDLRLARPVALKLLRPEILADADLAIRFRREAHAATVLRHPNVVACLDTGRDGDSPFLVMELVDGEDLAVRLRRGPRPDAATAARIAADVARGLAIAHARGIVHRDVKPGNILIAGDGRAMVTDFGIARLAAEAEATLPGTTLGSVHYFSPEQARGAPTTAASDVYSLGLVLFELLTGTRPFTGDSPAAIALARVDAAAPSARAVDPTVPPALDAIVTRALAQDPAARYPNGGAMADALDAVIAPAPTDSASATIRMALPGRRTPVALPGTSSRPARIALVGAIAIGVVAAIGTLGALGMLGAGAAPVADVTGSPPPGTTPEPGAAAASEPPASPLRSVDPTARTTPEPTAPPATDPPASRDALDLCAPADDESCPLDPGRYRPSRFDPSFTIELDDGWAVSRHTGQLVVFQRFEGYLTLASAVEIVFDEDGPVVIRSDARRLLDAFRENESLEILADERIQLAGRRAVQLDLVTTGDRTPLFGAGEDVYFAETTTVTRLIVLELRGTPVIIAREGASGVDLEGFVAAADSALGSLAFD